MSYTAGLCVLALVVLAALTEAKRPKWHELSRDYTFDKYMRDFGKSYKKDSTEGKMRMVNFQASLAQVLAHNADSGATYKLGINHMSDWTAAEKKRINGGRHVAALDSKPARMYTTDALKEKLPYNKDWRLAVNPSVLTAIKNQGGCGDCWAHAATETMESHYALLSGELHSLSQQQVTSCTDPGSCFGSTGCDGGFAELAFDSVKARGGIHQEWTYPFRSYMGDTETCLNITNVDSGMNEGKVAGVAGYIAVHPNDAVATMHALVHQGPLSIYVDAGSWSPYESGIFSGCSYANNTVITMDHAVQLVGYGTDLAMGMDYWIVRNSWGAWWGESGFIRLLRNGTEECGNSGGVSCNGGPLEVPTCGQCGLLLAPTYPIMTLGHQGI